MANNTITSNAITSFYNQTINYTLEGNEVSFKHIELLPVGQLDEPLQIFSSGVITKVKGATIKPIHQTTVPRGYKKIPVKLVEGQWAQYGVHRLIHFADNGEWSDRSEGSVIHHIDSNKANNRASNLMLTTSSDNISRFFDGRDNQSEIASQKYHEERIAKGVTALTYDGVAYPDYYVTRSGEVFHYADGQRIQVKTFVANKKYPTNHNLKINNKTMSLHKLMAQNYLILPQGKYKTLLKDNTLDNPFVAKNIYVMPLKKQFK